ncbi:Uncharacterized protein Adt_43123 [Abeliophyllum distichum]|uniref:Uncharacterized protein n=1 Tax=Abeliophyllum distichum TaxID=126358 RepID=A0ABD1PUJ6_9LAMI
MDKSVTLKSENKQENKLKKEYWKGHIQKMGLQEKQLVVACSGGEFLWWVMAVSVSSFVLPFDVSLKDFIFIFLTSVGGVSNWTATLGNSEHVVILIEKTDITSILWYHLK